MPTKKKKQSILSKLNLSSPKNRIALTVAIFAVVGGGIMVYQSFATTIIASVNADQMVKITGASYPASKKLSTDVNGKANVSVWQVPQGGYMKPAVNMSVPANLNYQVCYNVKGVGDFSAFGYELRAKDASSYKMYCTKSFPSGKGTVFNNNFHATFMNIDKNNVKLYLQNITIQVAEKPIPSSSPQNNR